MRAEKPRPVLLTGYPLDAAVELARRSRGCAPFEAATSRCLAAEKRLRLFGLALTRPALLTLAGENIACFCYCC